MEVFRSEIIRGNPIPKNLYFIDTNIIAHWCLGETGMMDHFKEKFELTDEFVQVYRSRYQKSREFIQFILSDEIDREQNEFYIGTFILNELLSAIRDEVISVMLFQNGIPISRWPFARREQTITESTYNDIYKLFLESLELLLGKKRVILIKEASPINEDNYLDIFSSILFLIKPIDLQDAMLLTTAIIQNADFFVTDDQRLRKAAKSIMEEKYTLRILNQNETLTQLGK